MIRQTLVCTTALLAFSALPAFAQNPGVAAAKKQFDMISDNLTKTAEKVPENLYKFKATPEVRSIGETIGHVADSNFAICSAALGEKAPAGPANGYEKGKSSKADLSKGLADSIAYCNKVIAGLDDKKGMEMTKFIGDMPRIAVIYFNVGHCNEHYGNLVTYMRLNKIVPPSTAGGGM